MNKLDIDKLFSDLNSDNVLYLLPLLLETTKILDRLFGRTVGKKFFTSYVKSSIIKVPPSVE